MLMLTLTRQMIEHGETGSIMANVGVCHVDALEEIADVAHVNARFTNGVRLFHHVQNRAVAKLRNRL